MKLHLPVSLHKALLACFAVVASITQGATVVVSEMSRVSEAAVDNTITIDYANPEATIPHVNGTLQFIPVTPENKGISLNLNNTGLGDGKTYVLFTDVTRLVDAAGNTITLDSSNNAISNYFDTTQPGTGFWADATLQLSADGILRLVRHSEAVKAAVTISSRRTGSVDYQYHEGVHFADIEYTSNSSAAYGGAIFGYVGSTITLSDNGSVSFSGNTASSSSDYSACGGAIDGGTITLSNNGSVVFEGNTASSTYSDAYGGAICGVTITLSSNGSVVFEGNTASSPYSYSDAYGGAIYGYDGSTITLSDNGSVTFSGNTASSSSDYSAYGGAICGREDITLSHNGSVVFEGNTASSRYSSGGAIYGDSDSTITLSDNGSVTFSGNTASSSTTTTYFSAEGGAICGVTITLSNNGSVVFEGNTASSTYSSAYGGAIYGNNGSTIMLSNNGSVVFEGNTASSPNSDAYGGAIYGEGNSTITLSDNGSVTFSGNTASSSSFDAYGGAIDGGVTMEGNGDVSFSGNTASSSSSHAHGGAIFGGVTMEGNGDVSFSGNTASASSSYSASGGAIYGAPSCTITLSDNGSVTFSGNTASSSSYFANGGAIYGYDGSTITLSDNGSVTFSGNTAFSYSSAAFGGAIYGAYYRTITLSDNGSVTFSGNTASGSSHARGGAINTYGDLSIRNNDSVEFYQNAEVVNGNTYRLRSIYADGGSGAEISLSAAAGKSITFRDSIYIGEGSSFKLNEAYEGKAQLGDIIFTGATTVDDLYTVKGNVAGTTEEIRLSRTTEVNTLTNLYGGRLRVEDGAIYLGQGITVHEGSEATVRVKDAELNHVGYDLTFNSGTALEVVGESTIRGLVNLQEGSVFKLEQGATLNLYETNGVALSVGGLAWLEGASTLNADLTLAEGSTLDIVSLDAGAVALNGVLTFGGQVTLGENLLDLLDEKLGHESSITLFTGLENVDWATVTGNAVSDCVWAGAVFSNMAGNHSYYLNYASDTGSLVMQIVPEPATATLSLLALAALAARRRRK